MNIIKSISILLMLLIFINSTQNAHAERVTQQEWQCEVDFHYGDSGVLFLTRVKNKVKGGIKIESDITPLNHRVSGSWNGRALALNRTSAKAPKYAMAAVIVPIGRKKARLGGRFGLAYQETWSGECELLSKKKIELSGPDNDDTETTTDKPVVKAGPSTSVKALPYQPTTKDRIKFSATASHPDGVRSISFILNGRVIKTCRRSRCEASSPPLSAGKHIWRVKALSKSGYENPKYPKELIVKAAPQAPGKCSIHGKATGRSSDIARIFFVSAYGPNSEQKFAATAPFRDGRFELKGLQPGRYKLYLDTRADTPIGVYPSQVTVRCRRSNTAIRVHENFEFR